MPKLSIIIPAYNCEDFIEKTIKSVLNQSFNDYELIVVNDGSTDKTQEKVEQYAKYNQNIRIFYQSNSGVSEARNFGLNKSTGEYIIFIDADDYILDGYFEYVNNTINTNNIDCIIFNYFVGNKKRISSNIEKFQIKQEEFLNQTEVVNRFLMGYISNSPWDKVFKKNTIKNILFPKDITVGEDALFIMNFFLNSTKIKLNKQSYYVYMQDTNGITKNAFSQKKLQDITFVMQSIKEKLQNQDIINKENISFMIFNQMLAYIVNSNIKILFSSKESKFFGQHIIELPFNKIIGIKKKISFLVLSLFYKFILKNKVK